MGSDCCDNSSQDDDSAISALQARVNDVLSGHARGRRSESAPLTLFTPFLPREKERASALAALWSKKANKAGGILGLRLVVDDVYMRLDADYPLGMVRHALELFLTHSAVARKYLELPSLEHSQPKAVGPSVAS